jgi:cytochrome c-type biogenesis protein CcmF
VAEFGELSLWAALPLAVLSAAASIAGASSGRRDLATVGGRAAEATAALLLLSLVGLTDALIGVELRYSYVAALSGFQEPQPWRVAALWSGPAGGLLTLTFFITASAALSYRFGRSRYAVARTGALAALAVIGILTVVSRAHPFAQGAAPALLGSGMPAAMESLTWQLEVWAMYLAVACGAFSFAGVLGEQLTESSARLSAERRAMALAAGLLTLALLSATWRAYGATGRLLDVTGFSQVAVHAPAWLLAYAYLHAPGGSAVPVWAARWRRTLGVAFFPAVLGDWAAVLVGAGSTAPATLWVGGLALGVVSGALAAPTRVRRGVEGLRVVPGFGAWALQGGLLTLGLAGLVAIWGLLNGPLWADIAWPVTLLALAPMAAWSVSRPAGRWKGVWLVATALAVAGTLGAYGLSGGRSPAMALAAGLALALLVGFSADMARLRAARRRREPLGTNPAGALTEAAARSLARGRAGRRWASALAHLGLALLVVGLSADALTETETRPLDPGETLAAPGGAGTEVRVTYLGLSRYQLDQFDKSVASFWLYRGDARPELVTAATVTDMVTRGVSRTPAVVRGILRDVIVQTEGRADSSEGIVSRVGIRPLAGLVWLGGLLLLASTLVRLRSGV